MIKNKKNRLGFMGAGNMAEAIIAGLIGKKVFPAEQISAYEINPKRAQYVQMKYGIRILQTPESLDRTEGAILLCVKPQQMREVLESLRPHLDTVLILTIAAGIKIKFYESILGKSARIIRVMPNTPALLGFGAAAYFANRNCTAADKALCRTIFSSMGIAEELPKENLLDAVTALSGSGPAFVYRFAAALIQGGIKVGLKRDQARTLALQTLAGAAQMLMRSGDDPQMLIQKVTSKGGTTQAGLDVLEKKAFAKIIEDCMIRAAQRAKEMSEEFGR